MNTIYQDLITIVATVHHWDYETAPVLVERREFTATTKLEAIEQAEAWVEEKVNQRVTGAAWRNHPADEDCPHWGASYGSDADMRCSGGLQSRAGEKWDAEMTQSAEEAFGEFPNGEFPPQAR